MDSLKPVSVTSLSVADIIEIELDPAVDSPMEMWSSPRTEGGPRSKMRMYALVLAKGNAVKEDAVTVLSLDAMMDLVKLGNDSPNE